ncbi:MAG TPA: YgiQ family radical SAM protein [Salinivirgaceae bacterium]|nr:YgiQ family radical SAM protein [Salinivirgaceae bacterium]
MKQTTWFPTTVKEMELLGWDNPDVIFFSGDAYIDHPSFGTAMIARVMEMAGMKVAIVPQPNWQDDLRDFKKFGKPKYFFAITAGVMDSMVNHYTAHKRLRSDDAYTPGGKSGFRPDYPTIVYTQILKKIFPDTPVIIGGVEASLRRFTHYDYWQDKLLPSILYTSGADILVFGMGEKAIEQICRHLLTGGQWSEIKYFPQIGYLQKIGTQIPTKNITRLPSHQQCCADKKLFAKSFKIIETQANNSNPEYLIQAIDEEWETVVNPPYPALSTEELDRYYELPFTRQPHPKYAKRGTIPAYEMIRHSVTIHRGCFGGCSFCTIAAQQGKTIVSRSERSILNELESITKMPDFKGIITDLGGPSANMYRMEGIDKLQCQKCQRPSCIFPSICQNLNHDHQPLIALYQKASAIPKIRKIFIGSGIRYDLLFENGVLSANGKKYIDQVIKNHVSGRLKVAPEHTESTVLKQMRKPSFELYIKFYRYFVEANQRFKLSQQLIPYFISSHPGCTIDHMFKLHKITRNLGTFTDQIQDYTPTPLTLSSTIYYSGIDPYSGEEIYVAKSIEEKRAQRNFFFAHKPEIFDQLLPYLRKISRQDIISHLHRKPSNKRKS